LKLMTRKETIKEAEKIVEEEEEEEEEEKKKKSTK
jgi:hypothetical protein